jgi:hypothetical protein
MGGRNRGRNNGQVLSYHRQIMYFAFAGPDPERLLAVKNNGGLKIGE